MVQVSDAALRANFNGIFRTKTVFTFKQIVTAPFVVKCPDFVVRLGVRILPWLCVPPLGRL
jgi:hypothetical protein